jgi:hypothetical protein
MSEQEIEELRAAMPLAVAPSQLQAAREKAQEYCVLGSEAEGGDQLAIYNETPAALADCPACAWRTGPRRSALRLLSRLELGFSGTNRASRAVVRSAAAARQ